MKKILFLCLGVFCVAIFSERVSACADSNCKPCPDGFTITNKCCRDSDKNDCITLGNEIEDCGQGQWRDYPRSLPVTTRGCCKDSTENNCLFINHFEGYCGKGDFEEYPYSPVKKCCKDTDDNDCIVIRAKRQCGEYQLQAYPVREADCCRPGSAECTGHVTDCPRCF